MPCYVPIDTKYDCSLPTVSAEPSLLDLDQLNEIELDSSSESESESRGSKSTSKDLGIWFSAIRQGSDDYDADYDWENMKKL